MKLINFLNKLNIKYLMKFRESLRRSWNLLLGILGLYLILFVPYMLNIRREGNPTDSYTEYVFFNGRYLIDFLNIGYESQEIVLNEWQNHRIMVTISITFTLIGILLIILAGFMRLINNQIFFRKHSIILLIGSMLGMIGTILFIPFGIWLQYEFIHVIDDYITIYSYSSPSVNFFIGFYFALFIFLICLIVGISETRMFVYPPQEDDQSLSRLNLLSRKRQKKS